MTRNKTLHLDHERKKFLGVCAGIARYLDVEPWTVRLVYIGCVIFGGWLFLPSYFICWYFLDDSSNTIKTRLTENLAVKHFRTVDYRKKIYRNTREGKWLGVCAGIADYLEVNVFAVRMLFLIFFFTTGGLSILFYLASWMVLDKRPEDAYPELAGFMRKANNAGAQFTSAGQGHNTGQQYEKQEKASGDSYQNRDDLQDEMHSKRREIKYCARKFVNLQNRMVRMEAYVTSRHFKLHHEFRNIS